MTAAPMTAADGTDLWVVVSSQGEYSDRSERVVCVCPDELTAQAYVEAAEHRAREIEASLASSGHEYGVDYFAEPTAEYPEYRSAFDPAHGLRFSPSDPTIYYVSKAPLRLSVPTPTGRPE